MLGSDAILRSLEAEGVEVAFGLPRHEQGAGHMAEGYARASGNVGVAIATSGPGATNLVTPIADAWMDSTPLVCVTGQVRSHLIGTDAFQECDITGITIPIVKHSWLVQDVDELPHAIKAAFHVASTGRCGPVLVDIPRDVQEAELDFSYPGDVDLPGWRPAAGVNAKQVRAAAKAVAEAQRPVLYVGGGTTNAEACEELRRLAELWHIPVVGPLKQILAELGNALDALRAGGVRSRTEPWLAQLAGWRDEFPLRYGDTDGGDLLKPQR